MKIIITENQLKRIILEQDPVVERGKEMEIDLPPNTFPSGAYSPLNTVAIDNAIQQVNQYVSTYPKNTKIIVRIESSESKVPNRGVKLATGKLSELRLLEVQKYLSGKLPNNVQMVADDKGAQGPDWDTKKGSNHPDYTKYQYVKLFVSVSGERETPVNTTGTTPNNICNFSESMKGGVASPSNNFVGYSKSIDISKMPVGSNFKIVLAPRDVPDMLVVKSGNKIINTGFVGEPIPRWNIMLATILYHNYIKNGQQIPDMFPKNLKKLADPSYFNDDSGLQELLGHVVKINWSKSPKRNVNSIMNSGGWWTFDSNPVDSKTRDGLFPGSYTGVAQFTKDASMNTVDIYVYSPIGTTVWDIKGTCM